MEQSKTYIALCSWEDGDVQEGDVFRYWETTLNDGRVVARFQRLSRGNPSGVTTAQIVQDYQMAGCWGPCYNNNSSMPHHAIRVKDKELKSINLQEAIVARSGI